jgi:hypothetical protein
MSLSLKKATNVLKKVFETIFSEEKVVSVRVIPKLDDLLGKAEKLKILREKLAFYRDKNTKSEERAMLKRGGFCCIGRVKVDAVRYYEVEIEKIALKIQDVKGARDNCNSGMGIVTFVSRLQVSRSIDYSDYRKLCIERLN